MWSVCCVSSVPPATCVARPVPVWVTPPSACAALGRVRRFWLTWLFVPNASAAYIVVQQLFHINPIYVAAFVLCCWRAQVR